MVDRILLIGPFSDGEKCPMNVERLCGKLLLIADKSEGTGKKERHKQLSKKLGNRFIELKCKEVENLLKPEIIRRILIDYKEDPGKIPEFVYADYKNRSLGKFIEDILKENKNRTGSYISGSSISDKVNFCENAISHMNEWNNLSENQNLLLSRWLNL